MTSIADRLAESRQLQEFRSQLSANPRLRWLLFGVFIVFMVYLALVLDDTRIDLAEGYGRIANTESKLASLSEDAQADFEAYYRAEEAANTALRARLWMASSEGLAGAEFQSWLRRIANENQMKKVRLDMSEIRPLAGLEQPLWRLEAELSGELTPSDARALIAAVAKSERAVSVERLSYSPLRGDRMTVQLAAYFLIESGIVGADR